MSQVYYLSFFNNGFLFPYELPEHYFAPGLFLVQEENERLSQDYEFTAMDNGVRSNLRLIKSQKDEDGQQYYVTSKKYGKFIFTVEDINPALNKYIGSGNELRNNSKFRLLFPVDARKLELVCQRYNFYFIGFAGKPVIGENKSQRNKTSSEEGHEMIPTWGGKSNFRYSGSVIDGTTIIYGRGYGIQVTSEQYDKLRKEFIGKIVNIGTSRTNTPEGSMGAWLRQNVTKTAIASYVGQILVRENFAERIGAHEIKITR